MFSNFEVKLDFEQLNNIYSSWENIYRKVGIEPSITDISEAGHLIFTFPNKKAACKFKEKMKSSYQITASSSKKEIPTQEDTNEVLIWRDDTEILINIILFNI